MDLPTKPKLRPRGAPAAVHEKLARLDVLAAKAIRFWEKTLDEKGQATTAEKIQVSKLVVEYAWGKPKQQVQVDAKVELNHTAHIQALHLLAVSANGPTVSANPLNLLGNPTNGPNQPLLASPLNPIDLVDIGQSAALAGGLVGLDAPPAGLGTPAGARAHGQAPPLDVKNDE
jgi:hypothetical protein